MGDVGDQATAEHVKAELVTGTMHVVLALARLDYPETKILNRHVRPLLAAIAKVVSTPARYFDRDWIDVKSHPVAHVGFAHERATGRTVVEAFVAVRTPFTTKARPSYLGKEPTTLEELVGSVNDDTLVAATVAAYGVGHGHGHGNGHGHGTGPCVGILVRVRRRGHRARLRRPRRGRTHSRRRRVDGLVRRGA